MRDLQTTGRRWTMSVRAKLPAVAVLAIAVLILIPGIASAHEETTSGRSILGWASVGSRAYVGVPNACSCSRGGRAGHRPRRRADRDVGFGDQTSDPCLLSRLRDRRIGSLPGAVRPLPGRRVHVHVSGTLEGTSRLSFTSGPTTFDEVQMSGEFPPVDAPTNADLATRIQRESDRTSRHRRRDGGGERKRPLRGRRRQREDDRHRRRRRRRDRADRRHRRVHASRKRA